MSRNLVRSLLVLVLSLFSSAALAHDVWISRGSLQKSRRRMVLRRRGLRRRLARCRESRHRRLFAARPGHLRQGVTGNAADGPTRQENVNEVVPYSQSLPSPDGAYWRCKRPDGSPRCFFAPPPGS